MAVPFWDPDGKTCTDNILEIPPPGQNRIHSHLEERSPNWERIGLDVLFEYLVDVWGEPVPYLRLFLDRPVLGGWRGEMDR